MVKINWKARIKNKSFWITLVPALLLTAQRFADLLGYEFTLDDKQGEMLILVNSVFVLLAVLGVVVDPTSKGFSDSGVVLGCDELYDGGIGDLGIATDDETVDELIDIGVVEEIANEALDK